MLPNLGWNNKIVWFLIAKWLLAFIIVIPYEAHDQDGGSMIKYMWKGKQDRKRHLKYLKQESDKKAKLTGQKQSKPCETKKQLG